MVFFKIQIYCIDDLCVHAQIKPMHGDFHV